MQKKESAKFDYKDLKDTTKCVEFELFLLKLSPDGLSVFSEVLRFFTLAVTNDTQPASFCNNAIFSSFILE